MLKANTILEYDKIKALLCDLALSQGAKERLNALTPLLSERECRHKMDETTEARRIYDSAGSPPLSAVQDIDTVLLLCEKGSMLSPDQLEHVAAFIASCKRMKSYLKKAESLQVPLAYYGESIADLSPLQEEIQAAVSNGTVLDSASTALRDIRRRIENESVQIKRKLDDLLRGKKCMFSDGYVSQRNGRFVLPVKKEYKNQFPGAVVDISGTGGTYFIEPASVLKMQEKINLLQVDEENEIRKVLYTLTVCVDESASALRLNMEAMITLDVIFAKARLSAQMKALPAQLSTDRVIVLRQARHPLLDPGSCVPLDFSLGKENRGIVITGPNTGGKTVALKTVGLLSRMGQWGLHVPVESAQFTLNNLVLCDIGDGQSITENLSTFSAHVTNIIDILAQAGEESLVLLDELGSGTDPAEGMGIAISILEELRGRGCLFVATTHYPEVKEYAQNTSGVVNARMAFDRESLRPLYRLEIGEAGESCALYIAERLGFPAHMLRRARREAYRAQAAPAPGAQTAAQTENNEVPPPHARAAGTPKIRKEKPQRSAPGADFHIGDSVEVGPQGRLGIVFAPADEKGLVGVQIQKEKSFISYKRLKLKTPASALYPPDYDFSILFDTVANRKARHQMDKHHVQDLTIQYDEPSK